MKIREHVPANRIVLVPTVGEQYKLILTLVALVSMAIVCWRYYPTSALIGVVCLIPAFLILLYILGELISHKVIIGKFTDSILLRQRWFLLVAEQQVIPFSTVVDVEVVYTMRYSPPPGVRIWDEYELHINYRRRQGLEAVIIDSAEIDSVEDEDRMLKLAADIRRIIGEEALKRREQQ